MGDSSQQTYSTWNPKKKKNSEPSKGSVKESIVIGSCNSGNSRSSKFPSTFLSMG